MNTNTEDRNTARNITKIGVGDGGDIKRIVMFDEGDDDDDESYD